MKIWPLDIYDCHAIILVILHTTIKLPKLQLDAKFLVKWSFMKLFCFLRCNEEGGKSNWILFSSWHLMSTSLKEEFLCEFNAGKGL